MNYNQDYEYEEEIDIVKLILFIFSKWRSIVAYVLVGAILGGALAFIKPKVSFSNEEKEIPKYTHEIIEDKVLELQENNAAIASQAVTYAMDLIEESKLVNVDPYNMYVGSISMLSFASLEDLIVMESALSSFNENRVLYNELEKTDIEYSKKDLHKLIWLSVSNQTEEDKHQNIATITAYGISEEEVENLLNEASRIVKEYLVKFSEHYPNIPYSNIKSDITVTENKSIVDYQNELYNNLVKAIEAEKTTTDSIEYKDSDFKTLDVYLIIGALLGGVVSAGVWFVVFFAGGKLYAVSDIEKKFRIKILGSVAVCENKNPIDKWIFHKINGLYSEFTKEEQEKIVLLNIKNELKKNENIKKVMLVSSLGEAMNDSAAFIKTGLAEAGYTVSDCVNVIGRPDIMENVREYDVVIIAENITKSNTKLVAEENYVVKEYMNNGLYIVLV